MVVTWFFLVAQLKGAGVVVRELVGAPFWVGVVSVGVLVALNLSAGGMRGITFVQGFQFFFIFLGILVPFVAVSSLWVQGDTAAIITDEPLTFIEETTANYATPISIEVTSETTAIVDGSVGGIEFNSEQYRFTVDRHDIAPGTSITWPRDALVPVASHLPNLDGVTWSQPFEGKDLAGGNPRYFALAVFVANAFGVMGMPHIVVRFYTNPNGREARRTSVWFMAMIVPYYAMLPLLGSMARIGGPETLSTGATDSATVSVGGLISGLGGEWVTAAVSAGAAAAFLSTSSGLLIAMAGAFSHDIRSAGVPAFRRAIWGGAALAIGAGLLVESVNISSLIGWSSTIAAASLAPLMLLGIWWTGLTRRGAMALLVVGGGVATITGVMGLFGVSQDGWVGALIGQPAVWLVPLSFVIGIVVSRRDRAKVADVGRKFALMHLPEQPSTSRSDA